MRYLDSSVVLDAIDPSAPRHLQVDTALLYHDLSSFAVSDLVRMECLIQSLRANDAGRLTDLRFFFSSVVLLPLASDVFDRAARLRADHKALKTPDAIHLAAALHHGCGEFWTNDRDLAKTPVALTFRSF